MQVHSASDSFGNLVGEMIGWLLGTERAGGTRHSNRTASMTPGSGIAADPLEAAVVEFEVEMTYRRVSSRVRPTRFGRPPFAAQPIVDAEIIDHESDPPLTR